MAAYEKTWRQVGELIWLNEKVGLPPTFSRQGIAQILSALGELIWLNEKV